MLLSGVSTACPFSLLEERFVMVPFWTTALCKVSGGFVLAFLREGVGYRSDGPSASAPALKAKLHPLR